MFNVLFDRFLGARPPIDAKTYILWEPCSKSHGEIVPGYASYLLALGFKVLVLMTPARIPEGLFSRMSHPRLILARLSQRRIRRLMRDPIVTKAAGIMITTAGKLDNAPDGRVNLDAIFGRHRPKNLVMVEHDVSERVARGVWDPRMITLRTIDGTPSMVVNPHDFGSVARHAKSEGRTVFVMVGAARAKRRNQNLVYDALERIVARGEDRFELRLIGKPGKESLPPLLRPYVTELGRLDFYDLYTEIEAADFIVTSFQADNDEHLPYRTTKTTGSFQLCYGFSTPCIVQRTFATGTALTTDNALFYDTDEEIFDALHRAIVMPADRYSDMVEAMRSAAGTLYDSSLANLKALTDPKNPDHSML